MESENKTAIHIDESCVAAFLRGELDEAGIREIERWYNESAENRKMMAEVYRILFLNDRLRESENIDVEAALAEFKAKISASASKGAPVRSSVSSRRHKVKLMAYRIASVAAAVVIAIVGINSYTALKRLSERPVVVSTGFNERSRVTLPDGTKVWLNSCSRIVYASSLFSRSRNVDMEGEAYFEVAKDPRSPFTVTTGKMDIKVLGTKFNVRNDDNEKVITTTLIEGSILAGVHEPQYNDIKLQPSQQLIFDTANHKLTLTDYDSAMDAICWIDGRIKFVQNTLEEIAKTLMRYYNADISITDADLSGERFSGDFRTEDGVYHILSILRLTNRFDYKVVNHKIEIVPITTLH